MKPPFKPLNYFEQVQKSRRNLPHWRQKGVTYFVTSRLYDSMPAGVLEHWNKQRQAWLTAHLKEATDLHELSEDAQHEYHRLFTRRFHELLDCGHGSCCLKDPAAQEILISLLKQGHRSRYDLDAWVIMPNHFHALVTPNEGVTLGQITGLWKGGSARRINLHRGVSGTLWQSEGFDHIVRSEAQLRHYQRYIAENPVQANLRGGFVLGFGGESGLSSEGMNGRFGEAGESG